MMDTMMEVLLDNLEREELQAIVKNLLATNVKYLSAIRWALGEKGEFNYSRDDSSYAWREELRELAGLYYDDTVGKSVKYLINHEIFRR